MKKSTKILIALTSLVLWVACQQKASYMGGSFVMFTSSSLSVAEEINDIVQVSIPVYAYQSSDGSVAFNSGAKATTSVTIELIDDTAVAGINYDLVEPANRVLEFQEDSIQYIILNILYDDSVTGTLSFSIQLSSATNGFTMGTYSVMDVRITDADKADEFLGSYTATAIDFATNSSTTWTMVIEEHDGSEGNRKITSGITPSCVPDTWGQEGPIYGTVSDDYTTFTMTLPQFTGYYYTSYTAWEAFVAFDGGYYSSSKEVTFTKSGGQWTSDLGVLYILSTTEEYVTYYAYFEGIYAPIVLVIQ